MPTFPSGTVYPQKQIISMGWKKIVDLSGKTELLCRKKNFLIFIQSVYHKPRKDNYLNIIMRDDFSKICTVSDTDSATIVCTYTPCHRIQRRKSQMNLFGKHPHHCVLLSFHSRLRFWRINYRGEMKETYSGTVAMNVFLTHRDAPVLNHCSTMHKFCSYTMEVICGFMCYG